MKVISRPNGAPNASGISYSRRVAAPLHGHIPHIIAGFRHSYATVNFVVICLPLIRRAMTSTDERTGTAHSPRSELDKPPPAKFLPAGDAAYMPEQPSVIPSSNEQSIPLAPEAWNKESGDANPSGLGLTREVLRSNGMTLRLICIVVATTLPLAVIMSGVAAPLALLLLLLGYKASIAAGIAAAGSSIAAATVGIFRLGRPRRRS